MYHSYLIKEVRIQHLTPFYVSGKGIDNLDDNIIEFTRDMTKHGINLCSNRKKDIQKRLFCKRYGYNLRYKSTASYILCGLQGRTMSWMYERLVNEYGYKKCYRTFVLEVNDTITMTDYTKKSIESLMGIAIVAP